MYCLSSTYSFLSSFRFLFSAEGSFKHLNDISEDMDDLITRTLVVNPEVLTMNSNSFPLYLLVLSFIFPSLFLCLLLFIFSLFFPIFLSFFFFFFLPLLSPLPFPLPLHLHLSSSSVIVQTIFSKLDQLRTLYLLSPWFAGAR